LGVSKTIFEPLVCLVQTMHLSFNDTNTFTKWTKTRCQEVVRGRLVARRRSQRCQEVVMWISIPCDRIRGLGASPEEIPMWTASFGLEYVLACLDSVARALAMYGRTLGHP
jgi:hypothetical protein